MTRYISHNETNKLIRKTLKKEFPATKFSVKKTNSSTRITYTGAVTVAEVKAIVGMFEGSSFDAMQDLASPKFIYTDGEKVSYGATYIFINRHFENSELEQYASYFADGYQWYDFQNNKIDTTPVWSVAQGKVICDRKHFVNKQDLSELVWSASKEYRTYADYAISQQQRFEQQETACHIDTTISQVIAKSNNQSST